MQPTGHNNHISSHSCDVYAGNSQEYTSNYNSQNIATVHIDHLTNTNSQHQSLFASQTHINNYNTVPDNSSTTHISNECYVIEACQKSNSTQKYSVLETAVMKYIQTIPLGGFVLSPGESKKIE